MLSNIALSHNGRFGETTALLDRCIFESSLKIEWLCHKATQESFNRFLADGLKTELELKKEIESSISAREGNQTLEIEKRMLKSISRHISLAGLTVEDIQNTKKLPNTASMIEELEHGRLMYVVSQRLGSHHVHGTWPSLLLHYLEEDDDGNIQLRDHDCITHPNQFVMVPLQVTEAMKAYISFLLESDEDKEPMLGLLESVQDEILKINAEMAEGDFEAAEEI